MNIENSVILTSCSLQGSVMTRLCDLGLGVALPFHSHVAMNAVISDYLPYASRGVSRCMHESPVVHNPD